MRNLILVTTLIAAFGLSVDAKCNGNCCRRMDGETVATNAAAKVKDPVCGMEVDPAKAEKLEYQGKTYYFCSKSCKDEFAKNPSQYIKAQPKQ